MDYATLKRELQTWLGDIGYDLATVVPAIIRDAEAQFNRRLKVIEMECRTSTDLVPESVTEEQLGLYTVPDDWNGHKTIERRDDKLWILYYKKIKPLSDVDTTNWLLDLYPDLYRYTALSAATEFLGPEDTRAQVWRGRSEQAFSEIIGSDQFKRYGGGPLRSRMPFERHWRPNKTEDQGRLEYLPPYDFFDLESSGESVREPVPGYFTVTEDLIRIFPKPPMPTP